VRSISQNYSVDVSSDAASVKSAATYLHYKRIAFFGLGKRCYTLGDGDVISFHIYANWFSPPSCG